MRWNWGNHKAKSSVDTKYLQNVPLHFRQREFNNREAGKSEGQYRRFTHQDFRSGWQAIDSWFLRRNIKIISYIMHIIYIQIPSRHSRDPEKYVRTPAPVKCGGFDQYTLWTVKWNIFLSSPGTPFFLYGAAGWVVVWDCLRSHWLLTHPLQWKAENQNHTWGVSSLITSNR